MATVIFTAKMGGEWYDIRFAFNRDLVDLIKVTIPSNFRKYDPGTHTWSAMKRYAQEFANEVEAHGHTVSGIANFRGMGPNWQQGGPGQGPIPPAGAPGFANFFAAGTYTAPNSAPPPRQGFGFGYTPPPWSKRHEPPKPPPAPPKPPPALTENWAKELMRRLPPELREKAYMALAKVLHTDLGGDQRLMQELNDARLRQDTA